MKQRFLFDIVLVLFILYTPWWAVLFLGFVGAFIFSFFVELIFAGLILDLLYGSHSLLTWGTFDTLIAFSLFFFAEYAKKQMR